MPKTKTTLIIGRFQPLHYGHEALIQKALDESDNVIVAIGSADSSVSYKNPFTFEQRIDLIFAAFPDHFDLSVVPIYDSLSNDNWVAQVRNMVKDTTPDAEIFLGGFEKEDTDYLKFFPEFTEAFSTESGSISSATDVRRSFFSRVPILPETVCSPAVIDFLRKFIKTKQFQNIVLEREYLDAYHASWATAPFPPIFVTADAIVVQNKQILLVERGDNPGKGLLALPGGFINQNEGVRDAAIRELREETKITDWQGQIPHGRLGDYIRDDKTTVYDQPNRSLRGRTITHAHLFLLPSRGQQFTVKGSDDAVGAHWHPIGPALDATKFFEDHYLIIKDMLKL